MAGVLFGFATNTCAAARPALARTLMRALKGRRCGPWRGAAGLLDPADKLPSLGALLDIGVAARLRFTICRHARRAAQQSHSAHPGPLRAARLEHVERLKLDGAARVLEQDHHELQVGGVADVAHHDLHVRAVQQQLAQQLRAAPARVSEPAAGSSGQPGSSCTWLQTPLMQRASCAAQRLDTSFRQVRVAERVMCHTRSGARLLWH